MRREAAWLELVAIEGEVEKNNGCLCNVTETPPSYLSQLVAEMAEEVEIEAASRFAGCRRALFFFSSFF